jgi:putative addiction module CopG family antidote
MPTQNVNLSDKQAKFIRGRVKDGGYRNASEVVRAGLRLLEQTEQENKLKLRALRRLVNESFAEIDGGKFQLVAPGSLDQFLDQLDPHTRSAKS